jgi:hypothetical protein
MAVVIFGALSMANVGIPLDEWNGSAATSRLHETIRLQIDAMHRQAEVAKRWQLLVVALGVIQTVAAIASIVQIFVRHS